MRRLTWRMLPLVGALAAIGLLYALLGGETRLQAGAGVCGSQSSALDAEEAQLVNYLIANAEPIEMGDVKVDSGLLRAAAFMAEDIIATDGGLDHIDSLGRTLQQRLNDCGYPWPSFTEVIRDGVASAAAMHSQIRDDPGVTAPVFSAYWRATGIARVQHESGWLWVVVFGEFLNDEHNPVPTATATEDSTPFPTEVGATQTSTPTQTPTLTPTASSTQAATPTATPTETVTPTSTATASPTATNTATPTPDPTATSTPTATATPISVNVQPGTNLYAPGLLPAGPLPGILPYFEGCPLRGIYQQTSGGWARYLVGRPAYVNSLAEIDGRASWYWLVATSCVP